MLVVAPFHILAAFTGARGTGLMLGMMNSLFLFVDWDHHRTRTSLPSLFSPRRRHLAISKKQRRRRLNMSPLSLDLFRQSALLVIILTAVAVASSGVAEARPRFGYALGQARDFAVREFTENPMYSLAPVQPTVASAVAVAKTKSALANLFTADFPCGVLGGVAPFNVLCPFNSTQGFVWPSDVPTIAVGPATGAPKWRVGPINYNNLVQYGAEALVSRAMGFIARHTTYQRGRISLCEGSRSLWGCLVRIAYQYVLVEATTKPDI